MGRDHDPFRTRLLRRRAPTLSEWCTYWLDTDAAKRPKSKKEDSNSLELHVYPVLGDTRIDGITRHDVQVLVARWADVMPRTVHRRYAVLRAALNVAVDAELLGPRLSHSRGHSSPQESACVGVTGRRNEASLCQGAVRVRA